MSTRGGLLTAVSIGATAAFFFAVLRLAAARLRGAFFAAALPAGRLLTDFAGGLRVAMAAA